MDTDLTSGKPWRTAARSAGENCVEIAQDADGTVRLRDSKDPEGTMLSFPAESWAAFLGMAKAGEFDFR